MSSYRERVEGAEWNGMTASLDFTRNLAAEADAEIAVLRELLRISRASEKEAWRYHPELMAERDALKLDAERYRWLRSRLPGSTYRIAGVIYSEGGSGVDEAIDAAKGG